MFAYRDADIEGITYKDRKTEPGTQAWTLDVYGTEQTDQEFPLQYSYFSIPKDKSWKQLNLWQAFL